MIINVKKLKVLKNSLLLLLIITVITILLLGSTPDNYFQYPKNSTIYLVDTSKSVLHWDCHHIGNLSFKSGEIVFTKDKEPFEMNLNIDMSSIKNFDIDNELLQGTLENVLKSDEFFNVEKYPEAKFESHSFTKINNDNYKFVGDFVIFDNGICSEFEGSIRIVNDSLYINTKIFVIDRTDWGLFYVSANNPTPKKEETGFVVTDSILLHTHIIAYKKK